jgi:exopolysaccharide biosynthesis protein
VVSFGGPTGPLYNAISGDRKIVVRGKPVAGLDNEYAAPRTAIGVDSSGEKMIIVVADGRQPFYSSGATMDELARLLVYYGAEQAINMDGGGSSTLVFENWFGGSRVVNSPIHTGIPGRERPVANHLGIFVK